MDITWYYHVGANNLKETFILNRYFHIFLQKFFVGTQADPIQGLQFFWSFLLAATALTLYLGARLLSPTSGPWNGILALLLFFSLPAIREISGIPYVDVTAMLMLSALLLVYVVSANFNHEKHFLLLLFGCLLFLGFKTKETVLPGAIMVFGFGLSGGRIGWRLWAKKLLWVCFGVLTGLAVLTILNALFLQDPLFGLRPEDIGSYMGSYFSNTRMALTTSTNASWIEGFFLPFASLPVLLYVVSGIQSRDKNSLVVSSMAAHSCLYHLADLEHNKMGLPDPFRAAGFTDCVHAWRTVRNPTENDPAREALALCKSGARNRIIYHSASTAQS